MYTDTDMIHLMRVCVSTNIGPIILSMKPSGHICACMNGDSTNITVIFNKSNMELCLSN